MRLSAWLLLVVFVAGGCRYAQDVEIEGESFFIYGDMTAEQEQQVRAVIAARGGVVSDRLDANTAVAIRGNAPHLAAPLERTEAGDQAITQWALDETTANHYLHLDDRAETLGVPTLPPDHFLQMATREEVDWNKVWTLGFGD
ncbi:hypothetical protein [Mucisphaera sp.]|uniref:hypothetical protein n=1 Tax=Mucisphaera sp. TaxID=2913024 RepID=UPI003D0E1884